ncbi:hypothetical protein GGX14DRAFT_403206 [Mycena pura]|uniref:Uncharacterized protein n=1 Tax=Mycena pura TaxID=153505 RepID=A0AAD6Y8M7_9AGAR|nr:hypothetical protein GGX14DRAFT_403206 [Mycena pura]
MLAVPVVVVAAAAASAKDKIIPLHTSPGYSSEHMSIRAASHPTQHQKAPSCTPKATFPPASPSWWRDLNCPSGLDEKQERKCSGCGGSFGTLALPSWHHSALINMLQQHNGHMFRPHPKHTMSPVCNDNTRALDLGCEVGIDYFAKFTQTYLPSMTVQVHWASNLQISLPKGWHFGQIGTELRNSSLQTFKAFIGVETQQSLRMHAFTTTLQILSSWVITAGKVLPKNCDGKSEDVVMSALPRSHERRININSLMRPRFKEQHLDLGRCVQELVGSGSAHDDKSEPRRPPSFAMASCPSLEVYYSSGSSDHCPVTPDKRLTLGSIWFPSVLGRFCLAIEWGRV